MLWAALPAVSLAQSDEIQVYDATIAEPGANELTLHANTTPAGRKEAEFPGGVVPDHSTNGAFEWAHGVTDAWEHDSDVGPLQQLDGASQQQQMLYAVVDRTIDPSNSIEFRAGHGSTAASDDLVLKFIWNHRF